MEQTTELRLAWRQEFASLLLDMIDCSGSIVIIPFCNNNIRLARYCQSLRRIEFAVIGCMVKRKLSQKGIIVLIDYLEMLEDCFTDYRMCLN